MGQKPQNPLETLSSSRHATCFFNGTACAFCTARQAVFARHGVLIFDGMPSAKTQLVPWLSRARYRHQPCENEAAASPHPVRHEVLIFDVTLCVFSTARHGFFGRHAERKNTTRAERLQLTFGVCKLARDGHRKRVWTLPWCSRAKLARHQELSTTVRLPRLAPTSETSIFAPQQLRLFLFFSGECRIWRYLAPILFAPYPPPPGAPLFDGALQASNARSLGRGHQFSAREPRPLAGSLNRPPTCP